MSRRYIYPILVLLVTVGLYYANEYVDKQNEVYPQSEEVQESDKEFDGSFLPKSTTGSIVAHNYFTLSYSEPHEQAEWVAYELLPKHLTKDEFDRPYFVEDRKVKTGSADWRNYKNSGYDRGHLCPAGDRRFSYNAYLETFLTSNISPQDRKFNGGIWNRLEQKVRYWCKQFDGVYVITGGILKDNLPGIGEEEVAIPEAFYKVVLDRRGDSFSAIAFIIPNQPTDRSFYEYAVPIDEVEAQTGIDFFFQLEDALENKLESTIDLKSWGQR